MTFTKIDLKSVAGSSLPLEERTQVLVVGGGPAGLRAAIEAARNGLSVILVDENPVSFRTMGDDVPLHYGQGMSGAARNRTAMTEALVASEPLIEAAYEAGVDVRLGTVCWALYANGPGVQWMPGIVAGLTDEDRGWLVGADHVIVAAGRRDMGLAFPGWEKPGVLGATAAVSLARCGALAPRRVVVLGSTTEALLTARALRDAGVEIAAIVEQAEAPVGPSELLEEIADLDVLSGHVVKAVLGREAVEAVLVSAIDRSGRSRSTVRQIDCDGVVTAVGVTPVIELLAALGVKVAFQADRAGYAPVVDAVQRTSRRNVYAVGDCAGIWPAKSRDRTVAEREARLAVGSILEDSGAREKSAHHDPVPPALAEHDVCAYRLAWVLASVVEASEDVHVCQCENVSAREILEVRPPRYLHWRAERRNERSLSALLGEGVPDPDQVKRLTRAGMGPCQGRRCREQVACLLALESATPLRDVPLAAYRAPVRPLSLAIASQIPEPSAQAKHWDVWFGIHAQWRPYWDVPKLYTVATNDATGPVAIE